VEIIKLNGKNIAV